MFTIRGMEEHTPTDDQANAPEVTDDTAVEAEEGESSEVVEISDAATGTTESEDTADTATHDDDTQAEHAADGTTIDTDSIIEAVLFASDSPLTTAKLTSILGTGDAATIKSAIEQLNDQYAQNGRTFRIHAVAGGFQMRTVPDYDPWLERLHTSRTESRLSQAALETLAIVAYKQPVLRADIEAIRGVAAGEVLRTLMDKGLVRIAGRAEELGRPMLYGTTRKFLEIFGLRSLKDLPSIEELPGTFAAAAEQSQADSSQDNDKAATDDNIDSDKTASDIDINENAADSDSSNETSTDDASPQTPDSDNQADNATPDDDDPQQPYDSQDNPEDSDDTPDSDDQPPRPTRPSELLS